jgi:5-methylcytosine-specific restriction endonuclease McrA
MNRKTSLLHASAVLQFTRGWQPMKYRTVKEAFRRLFNESTEQGVDAIDIVLDENGKIHHSSQVLNASEWIKLPVRPQDDYIGLPHGRRVRVPRVIIARECYKLPVVELNFNKIGIYTRDRGRCGYCQEFLSLDEATLDHVFPKDRGGQLTWENTALCCLPCNQKKANRTPAEAGMTLHVRLKEPAVMAMMPDFKATGYPEHLACANMAA